VGDEELGVHEEVEAAEGLVGLVDAVNQVEHLQAEVDDENVEEVPWAMASTQWTSILRPRSLVVTM